MNPWIVLFLVLGAAFGLCTYSWQHLFSEGPSQRREPSTGPDVGGRLLWAMVCTFLWPLMVLTGLVSAWRLLCQARAAAPVRRP